ncbi:hypothetical protein COE70_33065 [Bacillus cereus]|nr:hypothetical protein ICI_05975 [Bacillus cereus BAG1X2-1]PHA06852.1 hypothetical protein COE70_33065 [Bacillus cereus]HDR4540097.1 hypothetical protein [Bacillus cereus]
MQGPGGEDMKQHAIYDTQTKRWVVNIPLSSYAQPGEYIVDKILLEDNANHYKLYQGGQDFNIFFNITKK